MLARGSLTRLVLAAFLAAAVPFVLFHAAILASWPWSPYRDPLASRGLPPILLLIGWSSVLVALLSVGLLLRRLGRTRTRHHLLSVIAIACVIAGTLILLDGRGPSAGEPYSSNEPGDAVVVENPYDTGPACHLPVPIELAAFIYLALLISSGAAPFRWLAYGIGTETSTPAWRWAGAIYALGLVIMLCGLFAASTGLSSAC